MALLCSHVICALFGVTALRMFGYSKREAIGANINALLPEPISTVHDDYMKHYIRSGYEVMLTNSRTMFGKHRNGYIFPLLENAKAMDEGLAGAVRKLHTTDEFVFFYSKSFIIPEASEGSFLALGVSLGCCVQVDFRVYSDSFLWCQFSRFQIQASELSENAYKLTDYMSSADVSELLATEGRRPRGAKLKNTVVCIVSVPGMSDLFSVFIATDTCLLVVGGAAQRVSRVVSRQGVQQGLAPRPHTTRRLSRANHAVPAIGLVDWSPNGTGSARQGNRA